MKLDELESRFQTLVEVQLLKLLPGYKAEDRIAQKLAASMQSSLKDSPDGMLAPNVYVLVAHPATLVRWRKDASLLERLAEALHTVGDEAGWHFLTKPTLTTAADTSLAEGEIKILASFSGESVAETMGLPAKSKAEAEAEAEAIPSNAFLILHGTKIVPLNRKVVNIGRRLDNYVVIDDPRVSRNHAQLRVIKDHFVVFDLNSTGGTYVNGKRTNQTVLYPGDVISLAGVTLIFGQDLPSAPRQSEENTAETPASPGDRPTAVWNLNEKDQEQ